MNTVRDPLAGKLPVTLITGFLGSGKTTLISKLLRHPDMNRVAVVINEVGEIGIDHDIVAMSSENIALLANGCICCSVRTDLQETLRDLFARRRVGEIADFDRVIIETTGLADPAPVVQTLAGDTLIAAHFRLDGVVTLVDAVNGATQLANHAEPAKQIALADRVLLTKTDLASAQQVTALTEAIHEINPGAGVMPVLNGEVEPRDLVNLGLASARAGAATLRFLGEPLEGEGSGGEARLGRRPALHDGSIRTLSLRFDQPFTWSSLSAALELLATLRGPDLLRVKGIVNVEGKPVVVQGVQHIFHPPVTLDRWPGDDTRTRLVFITRRIEADTIRNLLQAVAQVASTA
ncbi:GTP-binding protein [Ramlibacter sp. PS3R-8]|uniref:CobW family GTP-binding protein n=1 Tax=Ramlibacter sp. PS3R-8 TaxID=3133437 RepID=UPI0030ABC494